VTVKTRKKLIEVALPLDAINAASAREKSIRHGHPSTLHLWWARRPLAAARAVIFAQMVDDPSEYVDTLLGVPEVRRAAEREWKKRREAWAAKPDNAERGPEPTLAECAADIERQRLFKIIEDLVTWENTTNEAVLQKARDEIWQSWRRACADNADHPRAKELFDRHRLPAFHDPFAGGGALPLEAQRLGLEAYASDLNPVAVLINKAMIEIPPKFAGKPPVNPAARAELARGGRWNGGGAQGLAEDVRYYGKWMRDEAEKRIGHLYPKIEITAEMAKERPDLKPLVGQKLTVIAWLWARTVKSPNPAYAHVDVPLVSSFILSPMAGKEAYVEPVIENGGYRFTVRVGKPKDAEAAKNGTKLSRGANFRCVMSGSPIAPDYIYAEANAGRMSARLMAIVAEGERGRIYLAPTPEHVAAPLSARPEWKPEVAMPENPRWFSPPLYGLTTYGDLVHRSPARRADHVFRSRGGSTGARARRRARRRPAG
jgi:putative DNA methylase